MKLLLTMLTLLAVVFGCDSDNLFRKIYNDDKCSVLNVNYTKQYGKIGQKMQSKLQGNCNVFKNKISFKYFCDTKAITIKKWNNSTSCAGAMSDKKNMPYNTCMKVGSTRYY